MTHIIPQFQDHCHNGMKCSHETCFCKDMSKQLFEPHGGFCVEPAQSARSLATDDQWAAEFYEPQQNVVRLSILTRGIAGLLLVRLSYRRLTDHWLNISPILAAFFQIQLKKACCQN